MKISNQEATTRAKFLFIRIPLMLTLILLVLHLFEVGNLKVPVIVCAAVTVLSILSTLILRMHFLEISVLNKKLFVRFYHLFPLIREFRMIEVPPGNLVSAEIKPAVGNLIEVLILTVNTTKGTAVFPALPLTLMNKKDREKVFNLVKSCI